MEYPDNYVDLFEFSQYYGELDEAPSLIILRNIINTVIKLKENDIFHRDLKDENILLDPTTLNVKIIDFGCATDFYSDSVYTKLSGTPEFMPPEAFKTGSYHAEHSTIWSLGIILFTLLNGRLPYEDINDFSTRNQVHYTPMVNPFICIFKMKINTTEEVKELINSMLNLDETKRPSLNQLCDIPCLKI